VRALVTGAAGFIGSHLVERLLTDGADVRGVDCFTDYYDVATKRGNLAGLVDEPRFELVEADLREHALDGVLEGVDVVFHLAGQPGVRSSWGKGFADYVGHNVLATQRLLEAALGSELDVFVNASSSSIYGNAPRYPTHEDDLPRPFSPYGVTKLAAEHLASLYAERGLPTVSLRYFTVYGPRQRPDMALNRFLHAALAHEPLPVYGDGEQRRQFTFVGDVVEATYRAAVQPAARGAVLNVCGGEEATVNDLLAVVADLTGEELVLDRQPEQPGDVRRTGGDGSRAADVLGFRPEVGIRDGIAAELAWIRGSAGHG
jgi:nucleoside-diphosphate-sugar epimerase